VTTLLVEDIGLLVHGDASTAPIRDTSMVIEDGVIAGIGTDHPAPDLVLSAGGLTVLPGLIDGHVHPTFGEWTPAQNAVGWIHNYLHGGTTSMVSAGELHIPGLDFDALTPELVLSIAVTSKHTTGRMRPSGVKVNAGTVLLVPGMTEEHFDRAQREGIDQCKFIFYDWNRLGDGEAQRYVGWAHDRGMTVKLHSGGVSRSGSSRVAGSDVVLAVEPDVVGHISGGPIPAPDADIAEIIAGLPDGYFEVCSSNNYRATKVVVEQLSRRGRLDRLVLGTDTPGGTGVIPRGMLRNICYLASVCGVDPLTAVAAATGQTARAHGLNTGVLAEGMPADLVVLGPITGSTARDGLECFALGDLPGIATVLVDGVPLVKTRSEQTPPPSRAVSWRGSDTMGDTVREPAAVLPVGAHTSGCC
jgi:enamidase